MLDFARKLVAPDERRRDAKKRVQYWTALALLRGVMSSPAAGVEMLNTRLDKLATAASDGDVAAIDKLPKTDARIRSAISSLVSRATTPDASRRDARLDRAPAPPAPRIRRSVLEALGTRA